MSDQASRHIAWESERVQASVRRAWGVLCGSIILLLVVGGVIALHLKRRITAPLEALLDGIDRVGHGDLTHRMVFAGDEEFRRLGEAFNRANESLARAQSGLLRAERMAAVGQMATGIAHEVGNPLASISSVVQMMRRGSHIPQDQQRLELIMHHIGRVSQIVRELLTFSRSRPEQAMQRQVNLNELLDQTLSLLQYDKRAANARIVCDCDTNLTLEQADPNRLALVFTNICLNAFDALNGKSQEGGYLRISAAREGQRVILNFEDNGEGMSSQQIRHAFEPFYTTKEPGSGTGLGLWICYQIIQDHGGTIAIGSHPGQGTKVTIELPDRPPREHSASIPFRRPMEESRNVVDA